MDTDEGTTLMLKTSGADWRDETHTSPTSASRLRSIHFPGSDIRSTVDVLDQSWQKQSNLNTPAGPFVDSRSNE
jgi:hypothetical protein